MGNITRCVVALICFGLLLVHYFDPEWHGISALNVFKTNPCDEKNGPCPVKPTVPLPSNLDANYFTSGPFLFGVSLAVISVVFYLATCSQNHAKKRRRAGASEGNDGPDVDPYDVIQCLRNRLAATETELAEMKSREDAPIANPDALALVPAWNSDDQVVTLSRKDSKSVCSGKSCRSAKDWNKADMTNADYVRKCKYMARKLKESVSKVKLLRTQIAMANDIKAEFDDLVEQKVDMGKQIVTLAKEKSEARRKIASLQVEVRTTRKQNDEMRDQNALLSKNNEQLATNLKNALRDKKVAKRQFDECNEELLLVRKKLDSMHQEKERLVVRIEDLEKKAAKIVEAKSVKGKETPTTKKTVDVMSIERSLMNLERSVEKNLRLQKSAESLFSEGSSACGGGDEKIAAIRRDVERMEEIYRVDVRQDSANETSYNNSESSVATKEMSSTEDFQRPQRRTLGVQEEVSVCCLDSKCSVCSKKDCNELHRSCSDIRCVMPYSEVDFNKGGVLRSALKRAPGIEKLADIFGNDDDFPGIGSALHRTKKVEFFRARSASPCGSRNKGSLSNLLEDFTTSEESLASRGTYEMSSCRTPPKSRKSKGRRSSPCRSRENEPSSNSKRSGKKVVSCFTNPSKDGRCSMEMTGCLNQDPELGDEEVIGDQTLAQISESATFVFGKGRYP